MDGERALAVGRPEVHLGRRDGSVSRSRRRRGGIGGGGGGGVGGSRGGVHDRSSQRSYDSAPKSRLYIAPEAMGGALTR